ncbi:MAG: bifunctional oligoribonuclease/PAP phosphatase NrnA [Acidobacteriota bacterium]
MSARRQRRAARATVSAASRPRRRGASSRTRRRPRRGPARTTARPARGRLWSRLRPLLRRGRPAVISTHINPDGDGLGSQLALAGFLRQRGLRVAIINSDPVPRIYRFMDPAGEIQTADMPAAKEALAQCDLFFAVDNGTLQRMGDLEDWIRSTRAFKVCIDHHALQDDVWDLKFLDESACSTGTLIYELIQALGGRLTQHQALAIYVALITDTGYFRFSRTDASTYRLAADLLEAGVDPLQVYHEIYERNSLSYVRLLGAALYNVRTECGGRLGWVVLRRKQIQAIGGEQEDTSDMVNSLLTVDGVRVALLFKELSGNRTKVSLRSKGDLDVNGVARRLGGGGHRNAAGILLPEPLERGIERVLAEVRPLAASE